MKLIDATWKGGSAYEVLILADKTPAVLPTSGKDVAGYEDPRATRRALEKRITALEAKA